MSERFNATDIALARRLRALEAAQDATIRASADLVATMLDARQARRLPAGQGHETLVRVGSIMADAIALQGRSVIAHREVVVMGAGLGLPLTSVGDACQEDFASPFFTGMALVEQAA